MINRLTDRSLFTVYQRQIENVQQRHRDIQTQLKTPTYPMFDSANWPGYTDDNGKQVLSATHGELVRDTNNYNSVWMFQEDDKWHQIGGVSRARAEMSFEFPPFSFSPVDVRADYVVPHNHVFVGDDSSFGVVRANPGAGPSDPMHYQAKCIVIKAGGVYAAYYRTWLNFTGGFQDCRVRTHLFHPDWDYYSEYETWHYSISNGCHGGCIFAMSNEVMYPDRFVSEQGPPGPLDPGGCIMFTTVNILDDVENLQFGDASIHASNPTMYQGSYLEVIRLGGADVRDLNSARIGPPEVVWDAPPE
jgi:hypothetical protein